MRFRAVVRSHPQDHSVRSTRFATSGRTPRKPSLESLLQAVALGVVALAYSFPLPAAPTIKPPSRFTQVAGPTYRVRVVTGADPHLDVTADMPVPKAASKFLVRMALWCPGDYRAPRYDLAVRNVRTAEGAVLPQLSDGSWDIPFAGKSRVTIRYRVVPSEPSRYTENVRISPRWAFVHGPAYLIAPVEQAEGAARLTVSVPKGWRVECALPLSRGASSTFDAESVRQLADSPFVCGALRTADFKVSGKPHRIVAFNSAGHVGLPSLTRGLKRVVEAQQKMMGELPYDRYSFFCDIGGRTAPGNGATAGMEHASSARLAFPPTASLRTILGLAAHELAHVWNDHNQRDEVSPVYEPRTHNLWFIEGTPEFFAVQTLVRLGLASRSTLARELREANRAPQGVSLETLSMLAWRRDSKGDSALDDVYRRGKLGAMILDTTIRNRTNGKRSLVHVLAALNQKSTLQGPGSEEGLRKAVVEVGGTALGPVFDRVARSRSWRGSDIARVALN